jgi:hypothetical protein
LDEAGLFDYDLKNLKLTESRSADTWYVRSALRDVLTEASIDVRKNIIRGLRERKNDTTPIVEKDLDFYDWSEQHQKAWTEAFVGEFGENAVLCSDSELVVDAISGMGHVAVSLPEKVAKVLRSGNKINTEKKVLGVGISEGYVYKEATDYEKGVIGKLTEILCFFTGQAFKEFSIRVFRSEGAKADELLRVLEEENGSMTFALNELLIAKGMKETLMVAYGEILRFSGSGSEFGKKLRESSIRALVENVMLKCGTVF